MSGQFKEAVGNLVEWLDDVAPDLAEATKVHGDMDTVTSLNQQHQRLLDELNSELLMTD